MLKFFFSFFRFIIIFFIQGWFEPCHDKNLDYGLKKFSMILGFEIILSAVSYQRKTMFFMKKNLKFKKSNTFDNVLINHGLFFGKNILCNSTVSNFENKD